MAEPVWCRWWFVEDRDELRQVEPGLVGGFEPDQAADPGDLSPDDQPPRFPALGSRNRQSPLRPRLIRRRRGRRRCRVNRDVGAAAVTGVDGPVGVRGAAVRAMTTASTTTSASGRRPIAQPTVPWWQVRDAGDVELASAVRYSLMSGTHSWFGRSARN